MPRRVSQVLLRHRSDVVGRRRRCCSRRFGRAPRRVARSATETWCVSLPRSRAAWLLERFFPPWIQTQVSIPSLSLLPSPLQIDFGGLARYLQRTLVARVLADAKHKAETGAPSLISAASVSSSSSSRAGGDVGSGALVPVIKPMGEFMLDVASTRLASRQEAEVYLGGCLKDIIQALRDSACPPSCGKRFSLFRDLLCLLSDQPMPDQGLAVVLSAYSQSIAVLLESSAVVLSTAPNLISWTDENGVLKALDLCHARVRARVASRGQTGMGVAEAGLRATIKQQVLASTPDVEAGAMRPLGLCVEAARRAVLAAGYPESVLEHCLDLIDVSSFIHFKSSRRLSLCLPAGRQSSADFTCTSPRPPPSPQAQSLVFNPDGSTATAEIASRVRVRIHLTLFLRRVADATKTPDLLALLFGEQRQEAEAGAAAGSAAGAGTAAAAPQTTSSSSASNGGDIPLSEVRRRLRDLSVVTGTSSSTVLPHCPISSAAPSSFFSY